ncbi:MAG: RNA polymerase sigma factor RpoD/SigA [Bacteroidetes bacterium]|nr:RNA polymerase sigma factor RpoD/SigA [Bacteroidota bacterium]MBU1720545.1 RNA polymerase sigma factor RpoD/SigA [Bacteroidota bacterium]
MRQLKITKQLTTRDTTSLDKYLKEIARIDLITADEEVALARKIREGDDSALQKLINSNLRFVVSVAKQYQNQGLSLPDLINAGNLGLIKAGRNFDETRGFKFISYSVWWIRQSILQALAEQARLVRLPLNKIGNISKIKRASAALEQRFERLPNAAEIAEFLEIPEREISQAIDVAGLHVSLDAPLADDDDKSMMDIMPTSDEKTPDNELIILSLKTEIGRALSTLTDRESEIIKYYFGLFDYTSLTLREISDEIGLSCERVRQIKNLAIRKLKHSSRNSLLRPYL